MKCRICDNELGNKEYQAKEMLLGLRDEFTYFQCASCGCLQIKTIPEAMDKYYSGNYYSYRTPQESARVLIRLGTRLYHRLLLKTGISLFGHFDNLLPATDVIRGLSALKVTVNSRILDVGSGSGEALWYLSRLGFKNLLGVDPFLAEDIHYGNGLKIKKCALDEVDGLWDVIMFNHSFEHISQPLQALEHVNRLLVTGGKCMIRIPVADSYGWRRFGVNWMHLDAPRHFFLHTRKSMQYLASQAGLCFQSIRYEANASLFDGSKGYEQGISVSERARSPLQVIGVYARYFLPAVHVNLTRQGDWVNIVLIKTS